jgi:hypothetical protein
VRFRSAILLAILLAGGCEQVKKEEPAQPSVEPAPADTTPATQGGEALCHPIPAYEIEFLRNRGLHDPIAQIVEDLRKHPEVIPHLGAQGTRRLAFYDPEGIRVLSDHWVYARFDDGHFAGRGVFEFTVQPGGTLSWKVVTSRMD